MINRVRFIGSIALLIPLPMSAYSQQEAVESQQGADGPGLTFVVGQRLWASTWDILVTDATAGVDPVSGNATIKNEIRSSAESHLVPITSFLLGYGDWNLSTSLMPSTDFSSNLASNRRVSRSEYDLSLGYAINRNVSVSLIYKHAKTDAPFTNHAMSLLGLSTDNSTQTVSGWAIGVSARTELPMIDGLALYGNVALGVGRGRGSLPIANVPSSYKNDVRYNIGEVGVAYAFPQRPFGSSWSLTFGYRLQSLMIKDVEFITRDVSAPQLAVSTERRNLQTTTQGFIFGLLVAF